MTNRKMKTFCCLFFILALCGCEKKIATTPFGELIPTPISTPDTYDMAVDFLTGSAEERIHGMWTIRNNYPDNIKSILPLIIANLYYDPTPEVRIAASDVLGEFGSQADQAVNDLIIVLQEDDAVQVRRSISLTLGEIGNPIAVPILAANLFDSNDAIQVFSARSIAMITGEKFTDWDSKGGYGGNNEGLTYIVIDARLWWEKVGKFKEWQ